MTLVADPTDRTYVGVIKDALDRAQRPPRLALPAAPLACTMPRGFANPTDPMPHLCTVRDAEVPPR